jgi:hypothetical protein
MPSDSAATDSKSSSWPDGEPKSVRDAYDTNNAASGGR